MKENNMNMYKLLEKMAAKFPRHLYLAREKITYPQFIEKVKARAASLANIGVKKGDTVNIDYKGMLDGVPVPAMSVAGMLAMKEQYPRLRNGRPWRQKDIDDITLLRTLAAEECARS